MLLALEATDRSGSLALVNDGRVLELSFERSKVTHSERLMPEVNRLLEKRSVDLTEVSSLAVARGPGSFTAIRLAVTTAKTLAFSLGAELVAPTTLRIMAEYAPVQDRLISTALDARRGEVYTQDFRHEDSGIKPRSEARLMTPEALREHCEKQRDPLLVFKGREIEPDWSDWTGIEVIHGTMLDPLVTGLVRVATGPGRTEHRVNPDSVSPCYVRQSDAQRSRSKGGSTA